MKNKPTKNFYFDESVNFWFLDREDFHNKMYEIETYFREKKFNDIPNKIRKIFEKILYEIIKKKNIKISNKTNSVNNHTPSPTIKDLIHAINNNCSLDHSIKMSLFRVNDICNMGSHHNNYNETILSCEILTLLKNFYISIIGFLELENENENLQKNGTFEDIYSDINIDNIISEHEIEINKKKSLQYYPDISVQQINIVNFIFKKSRKFIIPLYQRGYTWNEQNIEDLFVDILARMKDKTSHYFGVVAGKLMPCNHVNIKEIKIIDGQQRLTTSVLIVMACYYSLKKIEDININTTFDEFFECLGNKDEFINLFHNPASNGIENDAFRNILSRNWKKEPQHNAKYDRNLIFIMDKIEVTFGNNCDSIKEFMQCFLNFFTIAMVDFNSHSIDIKKELEIFENLNSKGKNLILSELIKNHIFNLCDEDTLKNKQREVESYFSSHINSEITRCIKKENKIDELNKYLEQFYCYLITYFKGKEIASNENNSKNNSNSLLKDFKEHVILKIYDILLIGKDTRYLTIDQYKRVVSKLSEFLINGFIPIRLNIGNNNDFYIHDFIEALPEKKKTPIYSLSFLIVENYASLDNLSKKDKKTIFKCYQYLIKIIAFYFIVVGQGDSDIKRMIVAKISNIRKELQSHKSIDEIYNLLTREIILSDLLKTKSISRDEMKSKIKTINSNWVAKTMLLLISYHISKDGGDPENMGKAISLEHIMPQELNSIWIADIRKWNNAIANYTDNEIVDYSNKHIHELGNYLLVTKDLNSKLSNKSFADKKNILKNTNIIQILTQSKYLDIDILQKNAWGFSEIEQRTELMANLALELSSLY